MEDYLYQYDGKKGVALYNFKNDKLLQHNVLGEHPRVEAKMEAQVKAIIQQYNNRMIEDRLTVK